MNNEIPARRDGFLLYKSFWGPISDMSDEQLGRLFRAIFQWHIDRSTPKDQEIVMAFRFFVHQFEIDETKYIERCEKNRDNVRKRWDTIEYDRIQSDTKHTDNDKEKDKEKDKENESKRKHSSATPPTLEEVKTYAIEINAIAEAEPFTDHYGANGWRQNNGLSVKDWKAAFRSWVRRAEQFQKTRSSSANDRLEIPVAKDEDFETTIF